MCREKKKKDCPAYKLVKLRRLEHSIFLTNQKIADSFRIQKMEKIKFEYLKEISIILSV